MDARWTTQVSAPVSRLVSHDEHDVVFATADNDRQYCLNAKTGEVLWDVDVDPTIAAVDADQVYFRSGPTLLALDRDTGTQQWRYVDSQKITDVVVTDSLVGLRTFEMDTDFDEDHFVVLDRDTGDERFTVENNLHSVFRHSDTVYVSMDDSLCSYDTSSGWETICDTGGTVNSVETDGSTLYLGTGAGMMAVDIMTGIERFSVDGFTNDMILSDETVYAAYGKGSQSGAIDTQTGNRVWSLDDGEEFANEIALGESGVYFRVAEELLGSSYLQRVSREWGRSEWTWERETISSIEVLGDVVVAASDGVVALESATGDIQWQSETMDSFYTIDDKLFLQDETSIYQVDPDTGTGNWSTAADAVAVDQQVYVASNSTVAAFPVGAAGDAMSSETAVYGNGTADTGGDTKVYGGGESNDASADTDVDEGDETSPDISHCPSCGTSLDGFDDVQFCPSCGQRIG